MNARYSSWRVLLVLWFAAMSIDAAIAAPADQARRGFQDQMAAWNRQDLEGALAFYWNSESMLWVNRSGVERGIATFAQAMRSDFAQQPQRMGQYTGDVLEARSLDSQQALLVVRWSIVLDGQQTMGGVSTQLWKRMAAGWRIVVEHAS